MCYKNFKAKIKQPDTQRKKGNKQNKTKNKKTKEGVTKSKIWSNSSPTILKKQ